MRSGCGVVGRAFDGVCVVDGGRRELGWVGGGAGQLGDVRRSLGALGRAWAEVSCA
jgi:hypothetical protein